LSSIFIANTLTVTRNPDPAAKPAAARGDGDMKKKEVKKLRLSRETLQALTIPDVLKAVGGINEPSTQTNAFENGCCAHTWGE
jgi:hypothetical protein